MNFLLINEMNETSFQLINGALLLWAQNCTASRVGPGPRWKHLSRDAAFCLLDLSEYILIHLSHAVKADLQTRWEPGEFWSPGWWIIEQRENEPSEVPLLFRTPLLHAGWGGRGWKEICLIIIEWADGWKTNTKKTYYCIMFGLDAHTYTSGMMGKTSSERMLYVFLYRNKSRLGLSEMFSACSWTFRCR